MDDGTSIVRPTELQAQANLLSVLQLVGAGRLRCSETTRGPAAATVAAVAEVLDGGDFYPSEAIVAYAWPLLVQASGLAELAGGRLQLTAGGRAALAKPVPGMIGKIWRAWIGKAVIDEFSRIEQIKGQRVTNVLTSAKTRRHAVAAALATCPPGEWVEVDDLFGTMRSRNLSPTVARSERALWKLYLGDPEYGSLGSGDATWSMLEGRYTLAVLFEYAATLGLIDVEYTDPAGARDDHHRHWGADYLAYLSRYDGLSAIRLNGLGSYILGLSGSYQRPADAGTPDRFLKVLSNLDIVATGPLPAADRLTLDAFGERTADHVWTVRADTLLAAIEGGRSPQQLLDFLGKRSTHDLPSALTTLAADVTGRAAKIRDRGVVRLIECADSPLAGLIAKDLGGRCTLIGERHLAVPVEDEQDFRKALRRIGYVPTRD